MSDKRNRTTKNTLRHQAEKIASQRNPTEQNLTPSESARLLHELQVHQVELEIQNEELQQTTRRLEQTQETFYLLFNHAPVGYLVLDNTGMIQRANATFCSMVGKASDQIIGHPLNHFIIEEDQPIFLSRYRAFYKNPAEKVIEVRMTSQEKGKIYTRLEGSSVNLSIQTDDPEVDRELLLTVSDITEQKKAEAQNRQNEARLQGLLEIAQYQPKDTQDLLNFALEKAVQLTDSQIGYIFLYDEDTQIFTLNTWSNEVMEQCKIVDKQTVYELSKTGIWGEAARQRKPIVINDFQADHPLKKGYPEGHVDLYRFLTIPVFLEDKIVAVVGVGNKAEDYDEGDVRQLTLLMDSAWKMVERQNAIQSLAKSEARYRRLAENAEDLIYRISFVPSQHFEYVSPSSTRITGFTPEDHYADPMLGYKLIHPDDLPILQKIAESGTDPSQPIVLRWVRKDGTIIWTEQKNVPIFDSEGKLITIEGIARDITYRIQIENELRENKERFQSIFNSMQEGFALHEIICDENGRPVDYRFLEVNPAFERLTGLRADYLIGRSVHEVLPNIEESWINVYGEVALTGKPRHFEDYSAELGKYYEVNVYSPRLGWFAVIFSDITERRQYEEERERLIRSLEEKNAELEQFTYTVSHDLKSPLITIKGFLGLLEQDVAEGNPEQIKSDIKRIGSAADKMKSLLDDLLELSRIGRIANPPSCFPFQEVVNQSIELLSARIEEKKIKVTTPEEFPMVYGDRARIAEVVQNLLENAIKYIGDRSEPQIEIGYLAGESETTFFVRDNGIGIERRYLDKVFGLFEKLDNDSEGTGVGLALVKRIIEFHKGSVWVESAGKNQGSTFYFSLPNPPPKKNEEETET